MGTKNEHMSPVTALLLRWLMVFRMAEAFARRVTLMEKFDPRGAAENAEMLEIYLRCMITALIAQLAVIEQSGRPKTKEEAEAREQLRAVCGALGMLYALAIKMRRENAARVCVFGMRLSNFGSQIPVYEPTIHEPGILDSS